MDGLDTATYACFAKVKNVFLPALRHGVVEMAGIWECYGHHE
jgi:hypothetical protein